jgi:hypothetical protein
MNQKQSNLRAVSLAFFVLALATIVAASSVSAAQLTLSWTDNSDNEDGFRIERKTGSTGTYAETAVVGVNTVSYVDSTLAEATNYCYRLRAYNASGVSGYSNEQCATTASPPPPTSVNYFLNVTKAGAGIGTVTATGINCGSDCSESLPTGTQVTLTAVAASGSNFAGWSGTGCGSGSVTITANTTCTATFNLNTYTLTVTKAGTGSGTVTATGITCGSDCSQTVTNGTQLTLTAVAASGSTFAGWTGSGCTSGTVTVTGNMTCTATFNLTNYTLTVTKAGTGSGTVTGAGINCGSDCSESVTSGTQVTLTAAAASGSIFGGWTGSGCTSGTVTITGNVTCTATFNVQNYTLAVNKAGSGSGTVTASFAAAVMSANSIVLEAEAGSVTAPMTIQADPTASGGKYVEVVEGGGNNYNDSTFGGPGEVKFSTNISRAGTYALWALTIAPNGTSDSFYVTGNGALVSEWMPGPYSTVWTWSKVADLSLSAGALNLAFRQREDGTKLDKIVLSDNLNLSSGLLNISSGINCGSDCSEEYPSGSSITLTATADSGSTFAGWTGTGCSSGTVTLTANLTCTATFNLNLVNYTLTVARNGTGSGIVTATGINCGSDCSQSYANGSLVTLTAMAAAGSTFAGWSGSGCSSGTVTITGNTSCTATFNLTNYTLTVTKAGAGSGSVSGTGINCGSDCSESVASGTQVKLTAVAASSSSFAGWTGSGCTSGTVTVTANVTCTATFNLNSFTLTISKAGNGSGSVTASGINCGSDCSESYTFGTSVVLAATAATGSVFSGWTGTGCASGTVVLSGNLACTATFNTAPPLRERIGIYRPSAGQWFLDVDGNYAWDSSADTLVQTFGAAGSAAIVGDWAGSGTTQLGLFQASTRLWLLDLNANRAIDACSTDACYGPFGEATDIPVVGRWNARGEYRIGSFRPSTGVWYLDRNGDGDFLRCAKDRCASFKNYQSGDLPVVGDWTGDGVSQIGLFRPSTGEWFLDRSGNKAWDGCRKDTCVESFGMAGDLPVSGDWNGNGKSSIGVWRPSTGQWFLDHNGNGVWDGCSVDICIAGFGVAGDMPVVGKW